MFLTHLKTKLVAVAIVGAWAAGLATGGAVWAGGSHVKYLPPAQMSSPPDTEVLRLMHQHHCWRNRAPADMQGKLPGHVVVTLPDGRTVYGGRRLTGKALDQAFNKEPAGLRIRAFCR